LGTVYKPEHRKRNKDGKYIKTGKENKYWWIQYCRNGKVYRESTRSTDYGYAKRLLKAKEGAIAEGRYPGLDAYRTQIEDLVNLYLKDYKDNGYKSIERAEEYAALIRKHFAGLRVVEITTEHLRKYREKRQAEKVKDSTINRELSALRRMYRLGINEDPPLVARIPKVPFVRENNIRTGFFEYPEFDTLRRELPKHLKVAATIAYYTGLRAGEIKKLRWEQVDWRHRVLRLETGTTKNNEGREVPLIPDLKNILEWWRLETRKEYPFCRWICHYRGQRIGSYKKGWRAACERAKLDGRLFHDFRRTGVRNLIRAGVPQAVAMEISGHKTISVFTRYNIVSHADIVEAGKKLTRYMKKAQASAAGS
jgi:integrase